jgi:hypothetical protein
VRVKLAWIIRAERPRERDYSWKTPQRLPTTPVKLMIGARIDPTPYGDDREALALWCEAPLPRRSAQPRAYSGTGLSRSRRPGASRIRDVAPIVGTHVRHECRTFVGRARERGGRIRSSRRQSTNLTSPSSSVTRYTRIASLAGPDLTLPVATSNCEPCHKHWT